MAAVTMLALAAPSHAYVLIDDFTVGDYHSVINWPNNHDSSKTFGLDRSHSAFGIRWTDLTVNTNFDHVPVSLDIGAGKSRVSYDSPSGDIATDFTMQFGAPGGPLVDLSSEAEFYVDLFTEDPKDRIADQWSMLVVDADGRSGFNGGFLHRLGGIRFKQSGFTNHVDWSRVNRMTFHQNFSPNSGAVPMAYTVTKIYAVSEPGTVAGLLIGAFSLVWTLRRSAG